MTAPFRLEALQNSHARKTFSSGEIKLDEYLKTQVSHDIRRHIANCFVAIDVSNEQIAGYYTLAAASIATPDLPPEDLKRLPRYPTLPAVRIGRLTVDQRFQGKGLGKALLADAAIKAMIAAPASYALIVDAKHETAVQFYQHHGFRPLIDLPNVLFLPLATAEKVLLA